MRVQKTDAIAYLFDCGLWIPGRAVHVDGPIGTDTYRTVVRALAVLEATAEPIHVLLNTPGGDWVDGYAIFDALSRSANHITITVTGQASSMGAVILQAGDTRIMRRHATMMLHDGAVGLEDVARNVEAQSRESARCRKLLYRTLADRTGRTERYFRQRMTHDWYLTAAQAVKEGLADTVETA